MGFCLNLIASLIHFLSNAAWCACIAFRMNERTKTIDNNDDISTISNCENANVKDGPVLSMRDNVRTDAKFNYNILN